MQKLLSCRLLALTLGRAHGQFRLRSRGILGTARVAGALVLRLLLLLLLIVLHRGVSLLCDLLPLLRGLESLLNGRQEVVEGLRHGGLQQLGRQL